MSNRLKVWILVLGVSPIFSSVVSAQTAADRAVSTSTHESGISVPRYKIDPFWPKELPNNWIWGQIPGIAVDKDDHIWVLHRPRDLTPDEIGAAQTPPRALCCVPAPAVVEFDAEGNVIKAWGGPGYVPDWPAAEHGISTDKDGNVWIGGKDAGDNGKRPADRQLLKFSPDGKQLLEIGRPSAITSGMNQDVARLGGPATSAIDDEAHEVYISDGYLNRRIMVYDSNTGVFKRGWGAYGIPLSQIDNGKPERYDPSAPPPKQFGSVITGIHISVDGLVYVCDRDYDRIQVFTKQGKFVKEFMVAPQTLGRDGSVWTLVFSHDPGQKYLLVGDGLNGVIWILNRDDGSVAGRFGHLGHQTGQFDELDKLAMDSHGNLYAAEVRHNNRIQKFLLEN